MNVCIIWNKKFSMYICFKTANEELNVKKLKLYCKYICYGYEYCVLRSVCVNISW